MKKCLGLIFVCSIMFTSLMAETDNIFLPNPEVILSQGNVLFVSEKSDKWVRFVVAYDGQIYTCGHMGFAEGKTGIFCFKPRYMSK